MTKIFLPQRFSLYLPWAFILVRYLKENTLTLDAKSAALPQEFKGRI